MHTYQDKRRNGCCLTIYKGKEVLRQLPIQR